MHGVTMHATRLREHRLASGHRRAIRGGLGGLAGGLGGLAKRRQPKASIAQDASIKPLDALHGTHATNARGVFLGLAGKRGILPRFKRAFAGSHHIGGGGLAREERTLARRSQLAVMRIVSAELFNERLSHRFECGSLIG